MKRWILVFGVMMFLSQQVSAERRVGVIAGLTGGGAEYAKSYQAGIELAVKDSKTPVKFLYEDDHFEPRLSVQAAQKLLNFDGVEALIVGEHASAEAVIPAIPGNIPVFVWAGEHPIFNRKNVFRFYPKEAKELGVVVTEIKKRNLRNIALLVSPHDYLLSWARGVRAQIPDRISYYEELPADIEDLKPIILKLKREKIANVALALHSPLNGRFAQQQKQLGLEGSRGNRGAS